MRGDVTYPGDPGGRWRDGRERPACAIRSAAVKDREWIPEVTRYGWVIITRDQRIEERTAEVSTVFDCGAKLFTISSPQRQLSGFEILEIVMCSWRRMEAKTADDGPFICRMTPHRHPPDCPGIASGAQPRPRRPSFLHHLG